jgi:hypothetical protein
VGVELLELALVGGVPANPAVVVEGADEARRMMRATRGRAWGATASAMP